LFYHDTNEAQGIALVESVADNKSRYTPAVYDRALLARTIQRKRVTGQPLTFHNRNDEPWDEHDDHSWHPDADEDIDDPYDPIHYDADSIITEPDADAVPPHHIAGVDADNMNDQGETAEYGHGHDVDDADNLDNEIPGVVPDAHNETEEKHTVN
jgi:hypothetical protein